MASSKSVVIAALLANAAIAVLKFVGFLLTGSAAMLSETYHSVSDTGNQIFLLIGIRDSSRERDRQHPFGYGKAQFFYSFLVSVLLFGIAGWESARHGIDRLTAAGTHTAPPEVVHFLWFSYRRPAWLDPVWVNYGVLIGAFVFEGWAFRRAYRTIAAEIDERGWSGLREAFRKTSDVSTLTALTEDAVAMSGAGIALLGVFLSEQTGDPRFDAAAAFLIGLLLMGFALALALENRRLLLGESLPESRERELRHIVAAHAGVEEIVDFRTVYFGTEQILVTADVAFVPDLATEEIDDLITDIEREIMAADSGIKKVYVEPET
ncbi:MAG: cation diffusion facilitator family transporter [Haloarculaceae archaeon]